MANPSAPLDNESRKTKKRLDLRLLIWLNNIISLGAERKLTVKAIFVLLLNRFLLGFFVRLHIDKWGGEKLKKVTVCICTSRFWGEMLILCGR
jgi:hypothetical protein